MSRAKDLIIKVIPAKAANRFVKKHHYSGKVVNNSQLHFGVFIDGSLHGVMQFGPSINKRGTVSLVRGTKWNEFIELNRMAFDEVLPKNSESRAISVAMKLLKRNAPHIKWVISFADAAQCGDGTIYRASGFVLVGYSKNTAIRINPKTQEKVHIIQAHHLKIASQEFRSWEPIEGYQLKYIFFVDKSKLKDLTVPIIPFSKIKEIGASMYRGKSPAGEVVSRPAIQSGVGGSIPTAGQLARRRRGRRVSNKPPRPQ